MILKFVKRANMWTITHFTEQKMKQGKRLQHQEWFSTKEEAIKYMEKEQE